MEGGTGEGGREIVPTFLDSQIHRAFTTSGIEQCRQGSKKGGGFEDTHAKERGVVCAGWADALFYDGGLEGGRRIRISALHLVEDEGASCQKVVEKRLHASEICVCCGVCML